MTINKFAQPGQVLKMSAPDIGFRFEWVPDRRSVYAIKTGETTAIQIAANIINPEAAEIVAVVWCRGYRYRSREIGQPKGVRHYQMLLEGGIVGAKG